MMDKTFSFRKDLYGLAGLMMIASPSVEVFAGESPAVAVFDIQDTRKKGALSKDSLNSLTGYVRSQMAKGGRFRVVPSGELQAALQSKKADSYEACYDEACQIEIGKEVAAKKSLATKIARFGSQCIITSTLYDLRKSTTDTSANERGHCAQDSLIELIDVVMTRLRGDKPKNAQASSNQESGRLRPFQEDESDGFAPMGVSAPADISAQLNEINRIVGMNQSCEWILNTKLKVEGGYESSVIKHAQVIERSVAEYERLIEPEVVALRKQLSSVLKQLQVLEPGCHENVTLPTQFGEKFGWPPEPIRNASGTVLGLAGPLYETDVYLRYQDFDRNPPVAIFQSKPDQRWFMATLLANQNRFGKSTKFVLRKISSAEVSKLRRELGFGGSNAAGSSSNASKLERKNSAQGSSGALSKVCRMASECLCQFSDRAHGAKSEKAKNQCKMWHANLQRASDRGAHEECKEQLESTRQMAREWYQTMSLMKAEYRRMKQNVPREIAKATWPKACGSKR